MAGLCQARILIGGVPEGGGGEDRRFHGGLCSWGFSERYCGARAWRGEKQEWVQLSDVLPAIHRKEKITNLLKQHCCLLDEYEWSQERKGEEERHLGRTVRETVSEAAEMQNQDADAAWIISKEEVVGDLNLGSDQSFQDLGEERKPWDRPAVVDVVRVQSFETGGYCAGLIRKVHIKHVSGIISAMQ